MDQAAQEDLIAGLSAEILTRQRRGYLGIDDEGILRHAGGSLEHYGLSGLEPGAPVLNQLEFLHGLVPLEGTESLHLPAVVIGARRQAALHLFRREGQTWVIFLDSAAGSDESMHSIRMSAGGARDDVLDKYLGREIAERVSKGFDSIDEQGERREVSVLFADLRGFTTFCDTNSTVDIFPLLNQFLGAMIKPVVDNKGIVDKIIGDAVMAVFGLGSDEEDDHKLRAIKTGKEMITRISEITTGLPQGQGIQSSVLGLGVGIASGDVVVGILGNERRRSFTVIGHRVNLAARLEGQARPGELLIDVATWEGRGNGQDQFDLTDLWLRGLTRPVPAMSHFPLR